MLEADSVTLTFGGRPILSGAYLSCRRGEIVGLLGRNGSGKSSLLKIIFGSLGADFKHLRIDGTIVPQGYRSGQLAYLPQGHFLPPFLRVGELLNELDVPARERIVSAGVLERLVRSPVRDLSGGELRFLECCWVLFRPVPFILLDEPFTGLAPVYVELLQQLITEQGKEKGIILTDHQYRSLLESSNRIVLLHNNSVYAIRDERDLVTHSYLPG